jgi:hypothetical protein
MAEDRTGADAGMIQCGTTALSPPCDQILSSEKGAVLQLAQPDLRVEVPGTLSMHAGEIELRASERGVRIQANDDVELEGERVHIN